jgi:hypothetical protein
LFRKDSSISPFHLFSIAIITPGKYCTIKAGAIPKLLALLKTDSTELIVNALKVRLSGALTPMPMATAFRRSPASPKHQKEEKNYSSPWSK